MTRKEKIEALREYIAKVEATPALRLHRSRNIALMARKLDIGELDLDAEQFGECGELPFEVTTTAATESPYESAVKSHLATIRQHKGTTR